MPSLKLGPYPSLGDTRIILYIYLLDLLLFDLLFNLLILRSRGTGQALMKASLISFWYHFILIHSDVCFKLYEHFINYIKIQQKECPSHVNWSPKIIKHYGEYTYLKRVNQLCTTSDKIFLFHFNFSYDANLKIYCTSRMTTSTG